MNIIIINSVNITYKKFVIAITPSTFYLKQNILKYDFDSPIEKLLNYILLYYNIINRSFNYQYNKIEKKRNYLEGLNINIS